ncbi:MAG: hypothetical protein AVDCRST_MAG12-2600, partial [uncultured Rubrobacteraceae bacterium]
GREHRETAEAGRGRDDPAPRLGTERPPLGAWRRRRPFGLAGGPGPGGRRGRHPRAGRAPRDVGPGLGEDGRTPLPGLEALRSRPPARRARGGPPGGPHPRAPRRPPQARAGPQGPPQDGDGLAVGPGRRTGHGAPRAGLLRRPDPPKDPLRGAARRRRGRGTLRRQPHGRRLQPEVGVPLPWRHPRRDPGRPLRPRRHAERALPAGRAARARGPGLLLQGRLPQDDHRHPARPRRPPRRGGAGPVPGGAIARPRRPPAGHHKGPQADPKVHVAPPRRV